MPFNLYRQGHNFETGKSFEERVETRDVLTDMVQSVRSAVPDDRRTIDYLMIVLANLIDEVGADVLKLLPGQHTVSCGYRSEKLPDPE